MKRILMICHGNICRSPMAEFVLKDMVKEKGLDTQFSIASAGTSCEELGHNIHPGTKEKLKEMHIPFESRRARQVTKKDYENYDYLLCMDSHNIRNLRRILGADKMDKSHLFLDFSKRSRDIADPWYTGNFDVTYDDILEASKGFLAYLEENT